MANTDSARVKVSIADLQKALSSRSFTKIFHAFDAYSKQPPSPAALAVLRKAIRNKDHSIVKCAAVSLKKLGPLAIGAMPDLYVAANRIDPMVGTPQAYPACLEAMVAIDPDNEGILDLITSWVGLHNWVPISAAMRALKTIGTPEALSLLHRVHAFWYSEFNAMQRRVADQLLSD